MQVQEAKAWLQGKRSHSNRIATLEPDVALRLVRTCEANAASMAQAYWLLRAIREGLGD